MSTNTAPVATEVPGGLLGGSFGGLTPAVPNGPTTGTDADAVPGTVSGTVPGTVPGNESPNGTGIVGPNSTSPSSGIKPDCFVPGNPCNLVIPAPVVR